MHINHYPHFLSTSDQNLSVITQNTSLKSTSLIFVLFFFFVFFVCRLFHELLVLPAIVEHRHSSYMPNPMALWTLRHSFIHQIHQNRINSMFIWNVPSMGRRPTPIHKVSKKKLFGEFGRDFYESLPILPRILINLCRKIRAQLVQLICTQYPVVKVFSSSGLFSHKLGLRVLPNTGRDFNARESKILGVKGCWMNLRGASSGSDKRQIIRKRWRIWYSRPRSTGAPAQSCFLPSNSWRQSWDFWTATACGSSKKRMRHTGSVKLIHGEGRGSWCLSPNLPVQLLVLLLQVHHCSIPIQFWCLILSTCIENNSFQWLIYALEEVIQRVDID